MREMAAKQMLGRRMRRGLGLADGEDVAKVWGGPPTLTLNNRAELLRAIRTALSSQGYEIVSAFRFGLRSHTRRDLVRGLDAVHALEDEERRADSKHHWWLRDVIWARPSSSAQIFARYDPDGNDLSFIGWGDESVRETMHDIEELLLAHAPA